MATLTLSIQGPHVGDYSFSRQIADADAARILAAKGAEFGLSDPQAIVDRIASDFLQGVLLQVQAHEQQQAARAAADAVPLIQVAP